MLGTLSRSIGKSMFLLVAGTLGCSSGVLPDVEGVRAPVNVLPGAGGVARFSVSGVDDGAFVAKRLPESRGDVVPAAHAAVVGEGIDKTEGRATTRVARTEAVSHPSTRSAKVAPETAPGGAKEPDAVTPAPGEEPLPVRVTVPEDSPVIVYAAPPGERRVIVYLHGHCGSVDKIGAWAPRVSKFGTVVALLGNWSCAGAPGRFRWGMSIRYLHKRILRAVQAVSRTRLGGLDAERITVIGYSQGAAKAEQLPRWYPERYPRIILAGPPTAPHPWRLAPAEAVVVIAGENENQEHIRRGFRDLQFAGSLAAFMELPEAAHGEFGPEAAKVLGQALWWLYDRAP